MQPKYTSALLTVTLTGLLSGQQKALPVVQPNPTFETGGSFTLDMAVEMAMKNNPRVLAAEKEVDAARGRSWTTWWLPDPAFASELEEIPAGQGLGSFGERKLAIIQSIDFPINIFFKKKLADYDVSVTRMKLAQTELEVRADVKQAYYDLLAKRDQMNLARENLRLAQEFLDKAQTRYDVGEGPWLEVVRAKVASAQAENDLAQAQSDIVAAQAALNALLSRPSGAPVNVADTLDSRPFNLSLPELKKHAFERHPRLRAKDFQVSMAQQRRNLAWGSFLPDIELSSFNQRIDGVSGWYGVEIGFSIPLWFPFRQRGNIREARGMLNAAQYSRHNEKNLLDADIESVFASVQSRRQQLEKYRDTLLQQGEEVYLIALRGYEEGKVGYLQLLEAQQTLIEIRRGYIRAVANYHVAVAELERATGVEIEQ